MGEPIHIRSWVSLAVMKIQAPKIWQDFPFKKYRITKHSGRAEVTLILRLAGNVGISDHWGKPGPFSSDCLVTENQKSVANAAIFWTFSEK